MKHKKIFGAALLLMLLMVCQSSAEKTKLSSLELTPSDRILILAPHPDDEVLGCAGIIQRALTLKLPVHVVFLTNGDNNQWSFLVYRKHFVFLPKAVQKMGMVRHDEAVAAAKTLGLVPGNLTFLGFPDFGTLNIWLDHWGERPPLRSLLTRASAVPYKNAFNPGAPHKGEEIVWELTELVKDYKPTKIFVSHPADHNGDHLAYYLFLQVALWDLGWENSVDVYPYLIHIPGWPKEKGLHPDEDLEPAPHFEQQISWKSFPLAQQEVKVKEEALKAHRSQYQSSPKYLLSFLRSNELFGDFSVIHLEQNSSSMIFPARKTDRVLRISEELTDEEQSAFVGIEWRFMRLEDGDLVISIELSRPLASEVEASVYIFGYRPDVSFGRMPKLHIKLGALKISVLDQSTALPADSVKIDRQPNIITIRVPLKILGQPQKILTSAHTYLGSLPLDLVSWRIVELN